MFCTKCGTQLPEDSGFCHKCGTKIVHTDTVREASVEPVPTSVVSSPTPISMAMPQMQANPITSDHRQRSVIGLCKVMFALRLVDAIGWTLLIILQIWGGVGFWQVIWNVICTIACYVFAVRLFGVISSNKFNSVRVVRVVEDNVGLAIVGGIFYGWQFFSQGIFLMFIFIGLEIAILVVGAIAYFMARQMRKEATPDKDMAVKLQQGEVKVLNGKCTRRFIHNMRPYSYNGIGTLTNMRFVFTSNADNTHEWAVDTYGENAPFDLLTDITILLSDITRLDESKNSKSDVMSELTIQTKAGTSYSFLLSRTLYNAVKIAIAEREILSVQDPKQARKMQAELWGSKGLCKHCGGELTGIKLKSKSCKSCNKSVHDCPICGIEGSLKASVTKNAIVFDCANCGVKLSLKP